MWELNHACLQAGTNANFLNARVASSLTARSRRLPAGFPPVVFGPRSTTLATDDANRSTYLWDVTGSVEAVV